jgi:hypothetical protein
MIFLRPIERPLKILFLASDAGVGLDLAGEFKKIKAVVSGSNVSRFYLIVFQIRC